jgi:hypothetical protein
MSENEPTTPEQIFALHKILRSDSQRFLRIVNDWIRENPKNSHAYFDRHLAWMKVGEPRRALEDLNKVIEIDPEPVPFSRAGRFTGIWANTTRRLRTSAAARQSIPNSGKRMHSACSTKRTPMHDWATRSPRLHVVLACRILFGRPALTALRGATKQKLQISCALRRRMRGASGRDSQVQRRVFAASRVNTASPIATMVNRVLTSPLLCYGDGNPAGGPAVHDV